MGMYAMAGAEGGVPLRPGDSAHDSELVHEVLYGSRGSGWLGVVSLSKVCRIVSTRADLEILLTGPC